MTKHTFFSSVERFEMTTRRMTHGVLLEVIEGVIEEPDKMVVIFRKTSTKPDIHWHRDLDVEAYRSSGNKLRYLESTVGVPESSIGGVITIDVIKDVSNKYNTKSKKKIEGILYKKFMEINSR